MKLLRALLGLCFAVAWAEELRISAHCTAMGTTYTIVAYHSDRRTLETAVDEACAEIQRIDSFLSHYRQDSELSRVNREAAQRPVPVSQELFDLLVACQRYSQQSQGAFDITVGPLVKIWGFYRGEGRMPHRAEIRQALSRVGYRKLELDATNRTVRFKVPGMALDPGGIGKGYAVDRVVERLRQLGIRSALISAGGSSIYALGAPPGQPGWKVQIRNPLAPSRTIEEVTLKDESISTSGVYEKYFLWGGRRYAHIFDPRTGYPVQGTLAVSVIAPKTLDSEAWTKPFFILGRKWTQRFKPMSWRVFYCEDKKDRPCAWLP